MKKLTAIIAVLMVLTSVLGGCKNKTTVPSARPNVPVVSESPAIPSPKLSPSASPKASPTTEPSTSPAQKQPAASPSASA